MSFWQALSEIMKFYFYMMNVKSLNGEFGIWSDNGYSFKFDHQTPLNKVNNMKKKVMIN